MQPHPRFDFGEARDVRVRPRVYLDALQASRGATYRDTRAIMRTSDAKAVSASGSLDIARN